MNQSAYNPDVLNCLASLSNDEVFTPPELAGQVLDLLPKRIWKNKNAKFLDPCCKSGVFLREIAKRLISGLKKEFSTDQELVNHICTKQLFGIAITDLTALMSRRTLYCSKTADGKYSVCTVFKKKPEGNIAFPPAEHEWKNGRCAKCGANQETYERDEAKESYAYPFIHLNPEEVFNMQFDVIIGNPPYQMSDGGDTEETRNRGGAMPLYHKFVQQAQKLKPRYLTMIIESRWFAGGRGVDAFRKSMLNDKHISKLVDYPISSDCFPSVTQIKGGVCYFLWDEQYNGDCEVTTIRGKKESSLVRPLLEKNCDTFIRYNESISILHKIIAFEELSFEKLVSSSKPFGFRTFFNGEANAFPSAVKLYANKVVGWVKRKDISQHQNWIDQWKVYISTAYGAGEDFPHQILNKPFLGEPNSCCTETYLLIGPFGKDKKKAQNVLSYISTRFFRFLVLLIKNTQHATQKVYQFVPMQDFSQEWTDEKLYKKYDLTQTEIEFIESMVRPM